LETAEEIVQDLFYVLWKERENLQIFTTLNGYLYRSVKNKALQHLEHEKVREAYRNIYAENASIETASPQDELEYKELEQYIESVLYHLPERRQMIFHKHRVEGKKYAEIARELQISVKTVEAEMSKTLRVLREKCRMINV
jgi:RNA polymerase sigma-70 factor (ECF subfamily)